MLIALTETSGLVNFKCHKLMIFHKRLVKALKFVGVSSTHFCYMLAAMGNECPSPLYSVAIYVPGV